MAKLSSKQRKNLKTSQFANKPKAKSAAGKAKPGSYPIPDISHARSALRLVAAHGTPAEKSRVRSAVYRKFPQLKGK